MPDLSGCITSWRKHSLRHQIVSGCETSKNRYTAHIGCQGSKRCQCRDVKDLVGRLPLETYTACSKDLSPSRLIRSRLRSLTIVEAGPERPLDQNHDADIVTTMSALASVLGRALYRVEPGAQCETADRSYQEDAQSERIDQGMGVRFPIEEITEASSHPRNSGQRVGCGCMVCREVQRNEDEVEHGSNQVTMDVDYRGPDGRTLRVLGTHFDIVGGPTLMLTCFVVPICMHVKWVSDSQRLLAHGILSHSQAIRLQPTAP